MKTLTQSSNKNVKNIYSENDGTYNSNERRNNYK